MPATVGHTGDHGGAGHEGRSSVHVVPVRQVPGEVLNMQQENNRVSDELQAGLDHIRAGSVLP
jgi:hypothetical protein